MTYKPFVKVPNLTQAGCTRQNRPGRDALIDLGHGSLILFRQNKADVPGPKLDFVQNLLTSTSRKSRLWRFRPELPRGVR